MGRQPIGSSNDSAEQLIQYTCQVRNKRSVYTSWGYQNF